MQQQDKRLDITADLLAKCSLNWIVAQLAVCTTVHLSGRCLRHNLSEVELVECLLRSLRGSRSVTELFVFRGSGGFNNNSSSSSSSSSSTNILTEARLAPHLPPNLTTLLLGEFDCCGGGDSLARALRQHNNLQRVTLNLPRFAANHTRREYGALDVLVMGLAAAPRLRVLQLRVVATSTTTATAADNESSAGRSSAARPQQQEEESLISPEALAILLNSATLSSVYLENLGLLDEHVDVVADELVLPPQQSQPSQQSQSHSQPFDRPLQSLDLSNNRFTEDALFSTGRLLASPHCCPLTSLDLSGVDITERGGQAVADGLSCNTRLLHLELEGNRFENNDEFSVPPSGRAREEPPWMRRIRYQLRLNRAVHRSENLEDDRTQFVAALSSVSDQVPCLYALLRAHPQHANHLKAAAPAQSCNSVDPSSPP